MAHLRVRGKMQLPALVNGDRRAKGPTDASKELWPKCFGHIARCTPAVAAAEVNRLEDAPLKTAADLGGCTSLGADYGAEVPI